MRFAPISSEPSLRLRFAVWIFRANAVITALGLLVWLAAYPFGWHIRVPLFWPIVSNVIGRSVIVAANLWIAAALADRRLAGFWIAVGLMALSVINVLRARALISVQGVIAVLMLISIASVWSELQQPGPPPNAR